MFERLCTLLLRLYPADLRRRYGDEAAHLVRDRAAHERGAGRRARLLLDLTGDLLAIWLRGFPPPVVAPASLRDGRPQLTVIDISRPRPEALAAGIVASTLLFTSFALLFQSGASASASVPPGDAGPAAASTGAISASPPVADHDGLSDTPLVAAAAAYLTQRYYDPVVGRQIGETLLAADRDGAFDGAHGSALADRLNAQIDLASAASSVAPGMFVADLIYRVPRSDIPLPTSAPALPENGKQVIRQQACGIEETERLPGDIAYLKLNHFPDPRFCRDAVHRAMASLQPASALVIDLRDNLGGVGELTLDIAAYLLDRPRMFYDPRRSAALPPEMVWPIPGSAFTAMPVYILTSSTTQAAAEYFVYNLKMWQRATIVGAPTAGRQHSGVFHRLDDHFVLGIQETRPPANPFPIKGWERIGVDPDVRVPPGEALDVAVEHAREALAMKTTR